MFQGRSVDMEEEDRSFESLSSTSLEEPETKRGLEIEFLSNNKTNS